MMFKFFCSLAIAFCTIASFAQNKDSTSRFANLNKDCKAFVNGKLLNNPKPVYPLEAKADRISGTVEVAVEIDEKGKVVGIESINGDSLLTKAASEAAMKALFSLTMCDGKPTKTIGIISFNFNPVPLRSEFFKPAKIEDLADIKSEDRYYESLLFLTENYQIAFSYSDQKYHPEMPLTKGDFAYFLEQTLNFIDARAEIARKMREENRIYNSFNPFELKEIRFDPISPSAIPLKTLLQKYKIVLADSEGNFDEDAVITPQDVKEIWLNIFGIDAIPINFVADTGNEISRGDFAIFLKESLDVLTYKLLP